MKIGFICPNLPGHLNPMTALARHLQARNHEVVFLYSTEANGLPFVPGPEKDHLNENRTEQSKRYGEDALRFGVRQVLAQTETILKSLPETVRKNGVDALLLDTVQFYAELGPMQLGMPYVQVSNGLHFDYSGYTPLCVYEWPHETTPAALARNREGVEKWADLFQSVNGGVRAYAQSIGLKIEADRPGSKQCHHRKAGAAIGVAETDLGLYHPCRVEHRARIFGSRRSAISYPDNL
jgi:zeaxanthin glucosyltransferase